VAILTGLYFGAFLQEFATDTSFRDACVQAGVTLPLQNPRIEVNTTNLTLSVFEDDTLIKRYDVGLGESRQPGIANRSANSTPLGAYKIISRYIRSDTLRRGARFLVIDYPREKDIDVAFAQSVLTDSEYERCAVSLSRNEPLPHDLSVGGGIGICGNYFVFSSPHFTDGSIALSNSDIIGLYPHIPVGTPVIISH
jgi:hypothetical protein